MAGNGRVGALPDVHERLTAEIGHSGLKAYGGLIQEEWDADLRGLRGVKAYDEMRRGDPTIAAGLRAITWILQQVNWTVQPGGETPADKDAASLLETAMHDMSLTWSKHIRDALTCLPFGWSWNELTYKVRNGPDVDPPSRYDDGRIAWRKMTMIGHDSLLRWEFDEKGGIAGLVQVGSGLNGNFGAEVTIPIGKSILYRLDDEKNNPEGVSLLRPVATPWYIKKNLQEIEAMGIERDLTGVLIIYMPVSATETDKNQARTLLEQYKADDMTGFIAPQFGPGEHERWRFEIINSPGSKSIEPDKVIRRYDYAIARSFLAQFLMLGQADAGSWALARDQRDMFEVALGAILMNLQETMNRFMVPPLFRLNDFGRLTSLPELRAGRVSKANMEIFSKALESLVKVGLLTPEPGLETYIREEMDLPELPEDIEQKPTEDTGDAEKTRTTELTEPFQFARPYNYAAKVEERANVLKGELESLAQQMREGKMSQGVFSQQARAKIASNAVQGTILGVAEAQGIPPSKVRLTVEQRKVAMEAVKEQYKYFADFNKDIRSAGKELTTAIDVRAGMYSGVVKSTAGRARLGEGADVKQRWARHKSDSCATCLANDGKVKTAAEWLAGGVWPGHQTLCNQRCGCSLDAT